MCVHNFHFLSFIPSFTQAHVSLEWSAWQSSGLFSDCKKQPLPYKIELTGVRLFLAALLWYQLNPLTRAASTRLPVLPSSAVEPGWVSERTGMSVAAAAQGSEGCKTPPGKTGGLVGSGSSPQCSAAQPWLFWQVSLGWGG